MKTTILLLFMFFIVFSNQLYAQNSTSGEEISTTFYIIAVIIGIAGNLVHVIKKQLRGESDDKILKYMNKHKISFSAGLIIAAIVVLGEGALLFHGEKGYIFTAFLTGYTSDSIFGKYVSKG